MKLLLLLSLLLSFYLDSIKKRLREIERDEGSTGKERERDGKGERERERERQTDRDRVQVIGHGFHTHTYKRKIFNNQ